MVRFSDLLGGGEGDEPEERRAAEREPDAASETPEDILERLTTFATTRAVEDEGDEPDAAAPSAAGDDIDLDAARPPDDDLLPSKDKKRTNKKR